MLSGWSRALGLVAVAALLANAQCYDTCAVAACKPVQTPSSDCPQHHQKPSHSSHEGGSGCQHQHSEFTGPESGIAKVNVAPVVPVLAVLTAGPAPVLIEPLLLSKPDTGSPPDDQVPSVISVLRI